MSQDKVQLGYRERDKLFKKYFSELRIKVALNWFELFALFVVAGFVSFKILCHFQISSRLSCIMMGFGLGVLLTIAFSFVRKYKLAINRFDKERIYKRVSSELLGAKE